MTFNYFTFTLTIKRFLLTFIALFFISCSDTKDGTVYNYIGPGSEWSISLDSGTENFTIEEAVSGLVVNGTYSVLDSGFTLLTVSSASGPDAPSAGDQAYGIEIPGYVFLLKPLGDDSEIISMVAAGSCPTEDFSANWMITSTDSDSTFLDNCSGGSNLDAVGTFSYTHSTTSGTLPNKYDVCGDTVGVPFDVGTITCSGGKASISSDPDVTMYMTQSGGMLVNFDSTLSDNNQIIIAIPNDAISNASVLNGSYKGFVVADNNISSSSFFGFMKATFDSTTNTIRFDEVNADTGETITTHSANGTFTIVGIDNPSNGFIKGTFELDTDLSPHRAMCIAKNNIYSTGKDVLFCVGENPSDKDHMFNLVFVSD